MKTIGIRLIPVLSTITITVALSAITIPAHAELIVESTFTAPATRAVVPRTPPATKVAPGHSVHTATTTSMEVKAPKRHFRLFRVGK